MKNKILLLLLLTLTIISCEKNDPVDDWARIGHVTSHTYWEIPSSTVNAGSNVNFVAQFYNSEHMLIDNMELWYDVNERVELEATCPIVTFKYTKNSDVSTLVRENQRINSYEFKESYWSSDLRAYSVSSYFTTSNTLKQVEWKEMTEFDPEKYAELFPDTFETAFKRDLYVELNKTEKFSDLRKLIVDLEVMTTDEFKECTDSVFNHNINDWNYFVKDDCKQMIEDKYFALPFEQLIFDKSNMIYKLVYSKSYLLNATYRVIDISGATGISESKKIELN